jgi:geranylgeranyl pyrophosphate synthase
MKTYKEIRRRMNDAFTHLIETTVEHPKIQEMMKYAIEGGKRLRPMLFLAMNPDGIPDDWFDICLVLELLHTCSLILDDLPCMDNDTERRGRPAFHIRYTEIQAKLFVSYCISFAIRILQRHFEKEIEDPSTRLRSLSYLRQMMYTVYRNMGKSGACAGQFLDLCPILPNSNKKEFLEQYGTKEGMRELLNLKTTTFFTIGFQAGRILREWEMGTIVPSTVSDDHPQRSDIAGLTGDLWDTMESNESYQQTHQLAEDFGFAFQLFDDFDDVEQDYIRKQDGEFTPNYILSFGVEEAYQQYNLYMGRFQETYRRVVSDNREALGNKIVDEICEYLSTSVNQQYATFRNSSRFIV